MLNKNLFTNILLLTLFLVVLFLLYKNKELKISNVSDTIVVENQENFDKDEVIEVFDKSENFIISTSNIVNSYQEKNNSDEIIENAELVVENVAEEEMPELSINIVEGPDSFRMSKSNFRISFLITNTSEEDVEIQGLKPSISATAFGEVDETGFYGAYMSSEIGDGSSKNIISQNSYVNGNPFSSTLLFTEPYLIKGNSVAFLNINVGDSSEIIGGLTKVSFSIDELITKQDFSKKGIPFYRNFYKEGTLEDK